jgi:hypothetical protein
MLRVQADLSFEQPGDECLLLFSSGIGVHNYSSCLNRYFFSSYDRGWVLTEDYIWKGMGLLKYQV